MDDFSRHIIIYFIACAYIKIIKKVFNNISTKMTKNLAILTD
jgi:hypothetical protein